MKRIWILLALCVAGCSTAPVADFLDWFAPGRIPQGAAETQGGVCAPQGVLPGANVAPVPPVPPGVGPPQPVPFGGLPPALPGALPPAPPPGGPVIPPPAPIGPGTLPAVPPGTTSNPNTGKPLPVPFPGSK